MYSSISSVYVDYCSSVFRIIKITCTAQLVYSIIELIYVVS